MTAYYNEIDPYAAQWLRNLIDAGHIAPGVVDERSIEDIRPSDLTGFTQVHFFAGIGVWSHALRLAGWPDSKPVWTGSCPCQPFSSAGKGRGMSDERHLWPALHHLIQQCRPPVVFGEQVASADGLQWLDLVRTDLEASDYACGAADLCAAGVGAPQLRQRLFWVAHAVGDGWQQGGLHGGRRVQTHGERQQPFPRTDRQAVGLADTASAGRGEECADAGGPAAGYCTQGLPTGPGASGGDSGPSPTNGFWRDADWLACRDGYWRPVEPGTQPLAHGAPARVGKLRAYGNAIVPQVAAAFIQAAM